MYLVKKKGFENECDTSVIANPLDTKEILEVNFLQGWNRLTNATSICNNPSKLDVRIHELEKGRR